MPSIDDRIWMRARNSRAGLAGIDHNSALESPQVIASNQGRLRSLGSGRPRPTLRPSRTPFLQRKCACGGEAGVSGSCAECGEKRLDRENGGAGASDLLEADRGRPTAGHRCDADEQCPEDEPANHRGFLGIAICNENTGKVDPFVEKEHCKGDCVGRHEARHVTDMSFCCSRFALCIKNGADVGARQACREKWVAYSQSMDNFTECNAYTTEDECLTAQLKECGFPDQDPDVEGCCQDLVVQQAFVRKQMKKYCPGVPALCPF